MRFVDDFLKVDTSFLVIFFFRQTRWCINITLGNKKNVTKRNIKKKLTYRVLEEVVRFDVNKIRSKVPNIFTIIDNANLREERDDKLE